LNAISQSRASQATPLHAGILPAKRMRWIARAIFAGRMPALPEALPRLAHKTKTVFGFARRISLFEKRRTKVSRASKPACFGRGIVSSSRLGSLRYAGSSPFSTRIPRLRDCGLRGTGCQPVSLARTGLCIAKSRAGSPCHDEANRVDMRPKHRGKNYPESKK